MKSGCSWWVTIWRSCSQTQEEGEKRWPWRYVKQRPGILLKFKSMTNYFFKTNVVIYNRQSFDILLFSDQDVQMDRLSNQWESHTSDKFTRESSIEVPTEKRRKKKKKTATIGTFFSLTCWKFLFGSKGRERECVDLCVQILTMTKWWTKMRPIRP